MLEGDKLHFCLRVEGPIKKEDNNNTMPIMIYVKIISESRGVNEEKQNDEQDDTNTLLTMATSNIGLVINRFVDFFCWLFVYLES